MKKTILILLSSLILLCCSTPQQATKSTEIITIRERIYDPSFDIWGRAWQDSIWEDVYIYDTIFRNDTIRTTFNEITKIITLKYDAVPQILTDTITLKSDTITNFVDVVQYKEVVPNWSWIVIIILLLLCLLLIKFKK